MIPLRYERERERVGHHPYIINTATQFSGDLAKWFHVKVTEHGVEDELVGNTIG